MGIEGALVSLAASIVGGLVVAFANHFMTKQRDHEKKLTELRVEHLIECWRKIERASLIANDSDPDIRSDAYDGRDDALARIKLLGTKRKIDLADKVTVDLSKKNSAAVVELLNELRDSLRRELDLEEVPKMENVFFRMHRN